VARWEPGAQERLCRAALDLYLERGFDDVTVAEITERAGLTRRTFFRYFTDKREVLFGGAAQLPAVVTRTVREVDEGPAPFEVVLQALRSVGAVIVEHATRTTVLVDGVKVLHDEGWVLAPPDPEEAVTHVFAEGRTDAEAKRLSREYVLRIRQLVR